MRFWKRDKKPKYNCKEGKHYWVVTKVGVWYDDSFHPPKEHRPPVEIFCPLCGRLKFRPYTAIGTSIDHYEFVNGRFRSEEAEVMGFDRILESTSYENAKREVEGIT